MLLKGQKSLLGVFDALRHKLRGAAPDPGTGTSTMLASAPEQPLEPEVPAAIKPVKPVPQSAPSPIANLWSLFWEISGIDDGAARQEKLHDFHHEVSKLKQPAEVPEQRPIWMLASALEGLLKQLSNQLSIVTPSVLGTVEGALELLETFYTRTFNPNLASRPIRLLAVDDDAVSRLTLSFALQKAFSKPDLAPDGAAALLLLAQQPYDAIFLDVEMPGMDGFELCSRIREQGPNEGTPVIFVTRHSDFESRAKSTVSGGNHLISKPFLSFEITLKALTVALHNRLQDTAVQSRPAREATSSPAEPLTETRLRVASTSATSYSQAA